MRLGGFQKTSLSDFPGKVAAICFTQGCNLRCRYCHNPGLVPYQGETSPEWDTVLEFLDQRKGQLDGVVFTGGEPLMQGDLAEAMRQVRSLNYAVKLDTNGTWPQPLQTLLDEGLIDYLAMDFKSDASGWGELTGTDVGFSRVLETLDLVKNAAIETEIRLTLSPDFHYDQRIDAMIPLLHGAPQVILQTLSGFDTLDASWRDHNPMTADALRRIQARLAPHVGRCLIR